MNDNIDKDTILFRSEPNIIAFIVVIIYVILIIYHAFTDHEITSVIGDNILFRIIGIVWTVVLISNQRSWIKLTDTSMIVHNPKKMLLFKMQTIEIPYKDIEIVRIPQIWDIGIFFERINIDNAINIKYKGNPQATSLFSIADIDKFITELKNRKINVDTEMDNNEFQQYIKTLNTQKD